MSGGSTDAVCSFVKTPGRSSKNYICDIRKLVKKNGGRNGRDSAQLTERVDIRFLSECATNCMGVISQNALSLIIAPLSGGNSQRQ